MHMIRKLFVVCGSHAYNIAERCDGFQPSILLLVREQNW
jgi:hypothetical protein